MKEFPAYDMEKIADLTLEQFSFLEELIYAYDEKVEEEIQKELKK
jgi:hypothetical protein